MIRRWCDVMGETNPVYTDPVWAARSVFGGVVAPPAMMDVFDKPGLIFHRDVDNPQTAVLMALEGIGCTSTVAVNSELEYGRYLRLGDLVHSTIELEDVSDEKRTGLGTGHFVTSRYRFFVGDEQVGSVLFRGACPYRVAYGPDGRCGSRPATSHILGRSRSSRPRGRGRATPCRWASSTRATSCRQLPVPITTTLVVSGALMTLDYFDGHHDRDMAVRRGSADVFMNIHTSAGLIERFISDWSGPEAIWRNLRLRLGAPNYPGDVMTLTGSVGGRADRGSPAHRRRLLRRHELLRASTPKGLAERWLFPGGSAYTVGHRPTQGAAPALSSLGSPARSASGVSATVRQPSRDLGGARDVGVVAEPGGRAGRVGAAEPGVEPVHDRRLHHRPPLVGVGDGGEVARSDQLQIGLR